MFVIASTFSCEDEDGEQWWTDICPYAFATLDAAQTYVRTTHARHIVKSRTSRVSFDDMTNQISTTDAGEYIMTWMVNNGNDDAFTIYFLTVYIRSVIRA